MSTVECATAVDARKQQLKSIINLPGRNRFDQEILRPFLGSSASQLAIRDGRMSAAHPLEYLIKANMLRREQTPVERQSLPQELAELLALQSGNGQWHPSNRLNRALGSKIPNAPPGVQDWRWATALAVIGLRRRPDAIDETLNAYSRAIVWVDEPLLAEAHARLPPSDLYYPVDDTAVKEGRWQAQVTEAIEEYGYEYFLPSTVIVDRLPTQLLVSETKSTTHSLPNKAGIVEAGVLDPSTSTSEHNHREEEATHARARLGHTKFDGSISQRALSRAPFAEGSSSLSRKTAQRDAAEQARGLFSELKRVARDARTTFSAADQVESCWRRPTRLDRPRIDPKTWYAGKMVQTHKYKSVDVCLEDRDLETLNELPRRYVRLASISANPSAAGCSPAGPSVDISVRRNDTPVDVVFSPASRRELAHIATRTDAIRRAWNDPITMTEELVRLKMMREEKTRGRPEFTVSFPAVCGEATKRLCFGNIGISAAAERQAQPQARPRLRCRRLTKQHITEKNRRTGRLQSRPSPFSPSSVSDIQLGGLQQRPCSSHHLEHITNDTGRRRNIVIRGGCTTAPAAAVFPALEAAQLNLVCKAMAYDRCVASAGDCIDHGAAAFRTAQTYSEQQIAFAETTAKLGPDRPPRAGYSDWRGRPIVGVQSATLDVVEAMDAWANEWVATRPIAAYPGRDETRCEDGDCIIGATAPPFLWEGTPLVLTIAGQTEKLVGSMPELNEWYGPSFPTRLNPFCLVYPIVDRPRTPCSASVKTFVNGKTVDTVSPMLLKQREAEKASLKSILDRQSAAPSWWPAAQDSMTEAHYYRVRRAEKILLREMRAVGGLSRDVDPDPA